MDELRAENAALKAEIAQLRKIIQQQSEVVAQLKAQLGQNSRNSNWPSSRDKSRQKRRTSSLRKKSGKKQGGQKGHKGHTLEFNPDPDEIKVLSPEECEYCQTQFPRDAQIISVERRQVLDLPPLNLVTTEYQSQKICCPNCASATKAKFPHTVKAPVQYGNRLKQLAVYLRAEQFIPYQRSQQFISDVFQHALSVGSLQNFFKTAAEQTTPVLVQIKSAIINSSVNHADETGFYIGGERHWLHSVSNEKFSYFEAHRNRGWTATEAIGLLGKLNGTLVHDAWATYFRYSDLGHALCNAHHLRELTAVCENQQQNWAGAMIEVLLATKNIVALAKQQQLTSLSKDELQRIHLLFETVLEWGFSINPLPEKSPHKRGRQKKSKPRNLLERLQKHRQSVLAFATDFAVPFDNNLAERDIRMLKVQQKISGCFRSKAGADQFCQLRSYTSTIRKHDQSVWSAIGSLFHPDPLLPDSVPV